MILEPKGSHQTNPFNKVYVLSFKSDSELEKIIYGMKKNQLRVFVYGLARGWDFDETCDIVENMSVKSDE